MARGKLLLFYKTLTTCGGAERLLAQEYRHFKARGYDVAIVAFQYAPEALYGQAVDPGDLVVLPGRTWAAKMLRLVRYLRAHPGSCALCASGYMDLYLASLLADVRYSLHIHQPAFMSFNNSDIFSVFMRRHFRAMTESNFGAQRLRAVSDALTPRRKLALNAKAALSLAAHRRSRHNFVWSDYAREEKRRLYGIDSHVVWGAFDDQTLAHEPAPLDRWAGRSPLVLCVARLDRNKRVDVVVEAFARLRQKRPDALLLVGGKGPELEALQALARDLGVADAVEFLGFIPEEELLDHYAAADLFVSLDWADFRMTAMEALAVGTKALMSSEASCEQALLDSGYVFLAEPTPEAAGKAMLEALETDPAVDREGLRRILRAFTWERYFGRIEDILLADPACAGLRRS
jgi:glycosyltransferase involved in cell wall biosynthesis